MAYITAKVWIKLHKTDTLNIFSNINPLLKESESNQGSDAFIRWFTMVCYSMCCKKYRTIRAARGTWIWTTEEEKRIIAQQKRDQSRKKKVNHPHMHAHDHDTVN
jgi:hypothetical protein